MTKKTKKKTEIHDRIEELVYWTIHNEIHDATLGLYVGSIADVQNVTNPATYDATRGSVHDAIWEFV
jgi:hypothetical protein